ncbi:PIN-like domain-containing protein (plasmid) [Mammaliicoccus sciuri]
MNNIKKLFPEFYQEELTQETFNKGQDFIIVLDTNYLLDILRKSTIVSEQYLEALKKVKNNIYIPYLVALEFNFNKKNVKNTKQRDIQNYKNGLISEIDSISAKIEEQKFFSEEEHKTKFKDELMDEVDKFKGNLETLLNKKIEDMVTGVQEKQYDTLIKIIEDRIGEQYDQKWIDSIETEGESRFKDGIPPGYDDTKKDKGSKPKKFYNDITYQKKYGDLIIWKDIIKYAKKVDDKRKLIFVTNDGIAEHKNDFLYKKNGMTIGPHIHLMNEIKQEADKEFYLLNNVRFVQIVNNLTENLVQEIENEENYLKSIYTNKLKLSFTDEVKMYVRDSSVPLTKRIRYINELQDMGVDSSIIEELKDIVKHERLVKKLRRLNDDNYNRLNNPFKEQNEYFNIEEVDETKEMFQKYLKDELYRLNEEED